MIYIQYLLKPSENFVDKSKIIIVREKLCESLAIDLALDKFVCAEKIKEMAFAGPCFHRVSLDGKIRILALHIKLFDKFQEHSLTINESARNFKVFF